jgi:hypothetical protein
MQMRTARNATFTVLAVAALSAGYGFSHVTLRGGPPLPSTASGNAAGDRSDGILHDCAGHADIEAEIVPVGPGPGGAMQLEVVMDSHVDAPRRLALSQHTYNDRYEIVEQERFAAGLLRLNRHASATHATTIPGKLEDGYYRTVVRFVADGGEEGRASISFRVTNGRLELIPAAEWEEKSLANKATEERSPS